MTSKEVEASVTYDIFTSVDTDVRWLATHQLCTRVARYFAEPQRADLIQETTIYVYGKLGKLKVKVDPTPYLETIAWRYMARNVCRFRKDDQSLYASFADSNKVGKGGRQVC